MASKAKPKVQDIYAGLSDSFYEIESPMPTEFDEGIRREFTQNSQASTDDKRGLSRGEDTQEKLQTDNTLEIPSYHYLCDICVIS